MKYILIFLSVSISALSQNNLQSGPMVGYCEMKEAMIWFQTEKPATVYIEYFAVDNTAEIFQSKNYATTTESALTCHVILDKIQPGQKYMYNIFIDKMKIVLPFETSFCSKKLWLWRENAPDFTIALGSCNYTNEASLDRPGKPYGSSFSIFESIAKKNPDIMIWGGDNIYLREADWDTKTGINHRYSSSRKIKELQPLLAKTQNFAIWDDHDFGPNDSDRSFYNKNFTQQAFKDFWANKFYGMNPNQKEGIYSSFNWSDAEVFLLDNRFFRSPNERTTGEKIMLGNEQIQWLIDALIYSKANFKIIIIGGQTLNTAAVYENYENYKNEKEQLLNEIVANKIKGVTFISGDRHFSELSKLNRTNSYPLYDWTVSPLTSGYGDIEKITKEDNKNRVEGSLFSQHVFGTLSFSGIKDLRQMKLTLFDTNGTELWNKVILKKDLE